MTSVACRFDTRVSTLHGELHVRVWGEGGVLAPLVLMHDSLGAVSLWREFPQALAEFTGRQVIAYDRAGFGQSVVRTAPVAADFIAAEAHEGLVPVLDHLKIEKAVLFGHSVGGGMALSAAGLVPSRVAGVITLAAQAFVEARTLAGVREAKRAFAEPGQVERLARYHAERAPWVLSAWIETWLAPSYADWSLEALLGQVQAPVLAMHGELDEYGSLEHPRRIVQGVGLLGQIHVFEGVGHMPHKEVTAQVLEQTGQFLDRLGA